MTIEAHMLQPSFNKWLLKPAGTRAANVSGTNIMPPPHMIRGVVAVMGLMATR